MVDREVSPFVVTSGLVLASQTTSTNADLWSLVWGSVHQSMMALSIDANSGDGSIVQHKPFDNLDVLAVQVPNGGEHPPLKISVGFGSKPFVVG